MLRKMLRVEFMKIAPEIAKIMIQTTEIIM